MTSKVEKRKGSKLKKKDVRILLTILSYSDSETCITARLKQRVFDLNIRTWIRNTII